MTSITGFERAQGARNLDELLAQCRDSMRVRRLSLATEKSYLFTIKGFCQFHKRRPETMGADEVRDYLTHLAVKGQVATSTQNVAFNALLILFRSVLEVRFPDIKGPNLPHAFLLVARPHRAL